MRAGRTHVASSYIGQRSRALNAERVWDRRAVKLLQESKNVLQSGARAEAMPIPLGMRTLSFATVPSCCSARQNRRADGALSSRAFQETVAAVFSVLLKDILPRSRTSSKSSGLKRADGAAFQCKARKQIEIARERVRTSNCLRVVDAFATQLSPREGTLARGPRRRAVLPESPWPWSNPMSPRSMTAPGC